MSDIHDLNTLYENLIQDREVRKSLTALREEIRDENLRRRFMVLLGGDFSVLTGLLKSEDPKVRRNAALLLGQTENEDVLPDVLRAWKDESTLFVRADYLKAVENLNYGPYLSDLRSRLAEIEGGGRKDSRQDAGDADGSGRQDQGKAALWDNEKHLEREASQIRKMLQRYERNRKHHFSRPDPAPDLILLCNRCQTDVTARQFTKGDVRAQRGSVSVRRGSFPEIMSVRTWSECLFPIPGLLDIPADEKQAARKLYEGKLYAFLRYLHGGEEGPYAYRIELKGRGALMERKGDFIRGLAAKLDMLEKGRIRNDDSDYEAVLRLIERRDGRLIPLVKLLTIGDRRFAYRKETTAQSMSPVNAALVVRLASPFLKEHAQVLDPFCGTGTLLIERQLASPCRSMYGIDKFGDAVRKARVNTGNIGNIHYINRDFFDFRHEYLFDELITELPENLPVSLNSSGTHKKQAAGAASTADQEGSGNLQDSDRQTSQTENFPEYESFARRFLRKAASLLSDGAAAVVVTGRPGQLEHAAKAISSEGEGKYFLLDRKLLNERLGTTELIFRYRA